jgi:sugar phosphate isomerase/epimerase
MRVQQVWDAGACVTDAESVHQPKAGEPWRAWLERAATPPIIEVMYPGYELGTGEEVERAIADRLVLAVDTSHVFIQLTAGAMHEATWRRLQTYDRIAEVHVSANRGGADTHQPIAATTFGLAWARERGAHVPVVLECYMHRLSTAQRRAQLAILTGSA